MKARRDSFVALHFDRVEFVDDLFPPVAADEEERKQEDATPDDCIPETANIVGFYHRPRDIDAQGSVLCQFLTTHLFRLQAQ